MVMVFVSNADIHRFAISILSWLAVLYQVLVSNRKFVNIRGSKVAAFYWPLAVYEVVVLTAYLVIWTISHNMRILSVDGEVIAYAVLDVLALGLFGGWLLITHRANSDIHVDIDGFWDHGFSTEGRIRIREDDDGI
jgi:bacteriorhodopsin